VRALAIRERALGADDVLTAQSLNNLALLYAAEGRFADAEPLYSRALSIFSAKHAPADEATTLENYAAMLADAGRADEAAAAEQRARALRATDVRPDTSVTD
jgi:tetratricopeptide (TPR) repeat protein